MAIKNFTTLEVGKTYLDRKGNKVRIIKRTGTHTHPFMGQDNHTYTSSGRYLWAHLANRDLITLVEEPSPKSLLKDGMVVRLTNGEYRLVLAGRLTVGAGRTLIENYTDDLRNTENSIYTVQEIFTIKEVKDVAVGNASLSAILDGRGLTSIWVRPEKSARDFEIEELQATLEAVTQKLNELKEGN